MKITSKKIDNIKNIRFGTFEKTSSGQVSYSDLIDVFDRSTMSVKLDFETPDAVKTEGEGEVISVIETQPKSGSFEIEVSRMPGKDYWAKFLGWAESLRNSVVGLGGDACMPNIYFQFDLVGRAKECGDRAGSDLVRFKIANAKINLNSLELTAATSDGPAENTFTITGSFNTSKDPDWQGKGMEIMFSQFDDQKAGFNQSEFIAGLDTYFAPTIPKMKAANIATTAADLTVYNVYHLPSASNVEVELVKPDGSAVKETGSITKDAVTGQESATISLTSLVAGTTYIIQSTDSYGRKVFLGTLTTLTT